MLQFNVIARRCPICGTDNSATLFAEANIDFDKLDQFAFASRKRPEYMHWRLWECGSCDLIYASPAPSLQQLLTLYHQANYSSSMEAKYASGSYGRLLQKIVPRLPDRSNAIDIGTGDGAFLHELLNARFSRVVGIEPSAAPISSANDRVRCLIRQEAFEPGLYSDSEFTLVTCFQTIEHLNDPLAITREVLRILKPGGAFFLIGHNRRGLSTRLLRLKSPIFDIEHLQLFSPKSLHRLLDQAGFRRIEVRPILNVYPISYWSDLFPFPMRLKRGLQKFLRFARIGKISLSLPAGNIAAVAYK